MSRTEPIAYDEISTHRFVHTLDVFAEEKPVVEYAPERVGVT